MEEEKVRLAYVSMEGVLAIGLGFGERKQRITLGKD